MAADQMSRPGRLSRPLGWPAAHAQLAPPGAEVAVVAVGPVLAAPLRGHELAGLRAAVRVPRAAPGGGPNGGALVLVLVLVLGHRVAGAAGAGGAEHLAAGLARVVAQHAHDPGAAGAVGAELLAALYPAAGGRQGGLLRVHRVGVGMVDVHRWRQLLLHHRPGLRLLRLLPEHRLRHLRGPLLRPPPVLLRPRLQPLPLQLQLLPLPLQGLLLQGQPMEHLLVSLGLLLQLLTPVILLQHHVACPRVPRLLMQLLQLQLLMLIRLHALRLLRLLRLLQRCPLLVLLLLLLPQLLPLMLLTLLLLTLLRVAVVGRGRPRHVPLAGALPPLRRAGARLGIQALPGHAGRQHRRRRGSTVGWGGAAGRTGGQQRQGRVPRGGCRGQLPLRCRVGRGRCLVGQQRRGRLEPLLRRPGGGRGSQRQGGARRGRQVAQREGGARQV
mmetsp:Transcript_63382/g.164714  ORF Transcript_63382/g.164714 Transcript_63382/m.164714 type:complete len:441 (+) Transcript_63382:518-1840(+)